jgi:hypothetical protein
VQAIWLLLRIVFVFTLADCGGASWGEATSLDGSNSSIHLIPDRFTFYYLGFPKSNGPKTAQKYVDVAPLTTRDDASGADVTPCRSTLCNDQ